MSKTVLVIAAHADDEALGCGGTLAKHVAQGDSVYVVFLADGVTSRSEVTPVEQELRNAAAAHALDILGVKQSFMLGFPDNRMDSIPLLEIVQKLESVLEQVKPHVVYTHHHGDLNIDHRIAHQAVMTACRPVPGTSVKEIYTFEVLSSTEWNTPGLTPFIPNVFVDISEYLDIKIQAISAYAMEMRDAPHSRSMVNIQQQAGYRGYSMGLYSAEAFSLIRMIL